jgi:predicted HicB family RNase H-like nuclease
MNMGTLQYQGYEGTVEFDSERKVLRGRILFISDLVTYEATDVDRVQKEFEDAVDDYLETCQALGRAPKKPCTGQFSVRVPPELHYQAAERAARDGEKLNTVVVRALDVYLNGAAG